MTEFEQFVESQMIGKKIKGVFFVEGPIDKFLSILFDDKTVVRLRGDKQGGFVAEKLTNEVVNEGWLLNDGACPVCGNQNPDFNNKADWCFINDDFICSTCSTNLILRGDDGYDAEENKEYPRFWFELAQETR